MLGTLLPIYLFYYFMPLIGMTEMKIEDNNYYYRFLTSHGKQGFTSDRKKMVLYDGTQKISEHHWQLPIHYILSMNDGAYIVGLNKPDENVCDQLSHIEIYNVEKHSCIIS